MVAAFWSLVDGKGECRNPDSSAGSPGDHARKVGFKCIQFLQEPAQHRARAGFPILLALQQGRSDFNDLVVYS